MTKFYNAKYEQDCSYNGGGDARPLRIWSDFSTLQYIIRGYLLPQDPQQRTSSTKQCICFQLTPPKPNIETLVNPYKPTSPASLFSEDQSCSGSIFIGPPETAAVLTSI